MQSEPDTTLIDRIAFSFFGGLTGAAYGALITLAIYIATEQGHPNIISWSAGVFACLGFFFGNFIAEAFLALIHFLWGLFCALTEQARPIEDNSAQGHLRSFLLLGFGTGLMLLLWSYF